MPERLLRVAAERSEHRSAIAVERGIYRALAPEGEERRQHRSAIVVKRGIYRAQAPEGGRGERRSATAVERGIHRVPALEGGYNIWSRFCNICRPIQVEESAFKSASAVKERQFICIASRRARQAQEPVFRVFTGPGAILAFIGAVLIK